MKNNNKAAFRSLKEALEAVYEAKRPKRILDLGKEDFNLPFQNEILYDNIGLGKLPPDDILNNTSAPLIRFDDMTRKHGEVWTTHWEVRRVANGYLFSGISVIPKNGVDNSEWVHIVWSSSVLPKRIINAWPTKTRQPKVKK